jgi:hypothetical protein
MLPSRALVFFRRFWSLTLLALLPLTTDGGPVAAGIGEADVLDLDAGSECVALVTGRRGERLAVLLEVLDPFFHDPAQFGLNLRFIRTVARSDHARTLADKALVLVRPLDNLDVPSAFVHACDSSMARFTSRS